MKLFSYYVCIYESYEFQKVINTMPVTYREVIEIHDIFAFH